ncbi:Anaphase promoting complex subunit 7 [Clydaea vesicula]|uniref:Anaphase promoting complex subunit 7 n=1 Tax=Clydaea vesicula TaxID=447962 RepID=A0AAD5XZW4_9FUNG|nr:Anaphase promoting complex subunit 7 [Clydaea vesicula]
MSLPMISNKFYNDALNLFEQKLFYSSELILGKLISGFSNLNSLEVQQNLVLKIKTLELFADCLLENKEYFRAITYYKKSIQQTKIFKQKFKLHENFLRVKAARVAIFINEYKVAATILEGITENLRSIEVLKLLAKVYEENGQTFSAINVYKKIIEMQPLAIEAQLALIRLNVSLDDILTTSNSGILIKKKIVKPDFSAFGGMVGQGEQDYDQENWTHNFLQAHQLLFCQNYTRMVRKQDPEVLDQMDYYASTIKGKGSSYVINRLAEELLKISDERPEAWLIMAKYCEIKNEIEKALYFSDKAIALNKRHVAAYHLKGSILLANQDYELSLETYKKAHHISNDIFSFIGLVESYIGLKKFSEAELFSIDCHETMKGNPLAETLRGQVLFKTKKIPESIELFRHAIAIDPKCSKAVSLLAEVYVADEKYMEAIDLLEATLENNHNSGILTLLAECYIAISNFDKAMQHLNNSAMLNQDCLKTKNLIERVEKLINGTLTEPEDMADESMVVEDTSLSP